MRQLELLPGANTQERVQFLQGGIILGALGGIVIDQALVEKTRRHTLLLSLEHLVYPDIGKVGRLLTKGGGTFPDFCNRCIEFGRRLCKKARFGRDG